MKKGEKRQKSMDSCPFGFAQGRLCAGMTNIKNLRLSALISG